MRVSASTMSMGRSEPCDSGSLGVRTIRNIACALLAQSPGRLAQREFGLFRCKRPDLSQFRPELGLKLS